MKTCISYDKCMNKEQHKGIGFFLLTNINHFVL